MPFGYVPIRHTLQYRTLDEWDDHEGAFCPTIAPGIGWRVKPEPRTFWSFPHRNCVEFITTTDAAIAKHWREAGHWVIVSTEVIPK